MNDRNTNPSWSYDADGRVLWGDETGYLYDAKGNVISFGDFAEVKTNQVFDGEGRRVRTEEWKFNESAWQSQSVTYYLTSSVLGGAVVTELSSDGAKRRTFVHAGGSILAWQWKGAGGVNDSVEWEHRDASNASFRVTNSAGNVIGEGVASYLEAEPQELDPAGADAGLSAPLYTPVPPEEPVGSLLPYPMMRDPSHPGVTYAIDGIPVSVDSFMSAVESSFPSRFDLLEMSARASRPRLLGSRVYDPAGRLVGQYAPADAGRAVAMAFEYNGTLERDWLVTDNWTAALNFLNFTEQPIAPQNPYPGFDRGKLGDVNKALDKGAKLLKNSDCQKGLAQAGINVSDLLNAFGSLKARPASDPSSRGYNIFYAEKSTDPQVQQFMQTEKGKGAGGFIFGQDVMLRDTFFYARGGAKIAGGVAQALALIHEAIHLTGKSDEFFGGSSKLNDVVIHACFSKLYGHNDLAIVGN